MNVREILLLVFDILFSHHYRNLVIHVLGTSYKYCDYLKKTMTNRI